MAQIHITLNQEELLAFLCKNNVELMKFLLERSLNEVMKVQSEVQLGASPYARSEERSDYRNGFRDRAFTTRIGTITLHVPRHRFNAFKTPIFERYFALITTMSEMVVSGVSTRKISKVVDSLCGETISKSAVSNICKKLDAEVKEFQERPLTEPYPFLTVDATYFKVRENHKIISKPLFIVYGTNMQGYREIINLSREKPSLDKLNRYRCEVMSQFTR